MSRDDSPQAIPAELEAEMTPAVRAFTLVLLARIAKLETRLNKTPQNSSLPTQDQQDIDESPTKEARSKAWLWVPRISSRTVLKPRRTSKTPRATSAALPKPPCGA
jgi:hypothetical protein